MSMSHDGFTRRASFCTAVAGAGLLVALALVPVRVHAQSVAPSSVTFATDDVRAAFLSTGLEVDRAATWTWTRPTVTSFQVRDAARGRVVMVLVYPNPETAQLARQEAQAREQLGGDTDPHLIDGYGPSSWHGNVALVQATQAELNQRYRLELDRANGVDGAVAPVTEVQPSHVTVDAELLTALDRQVVLL
jgi:hypothetical protein